MSWVELAVVVLAIITLVLLITNLVLFRQLGILMMGQARTAEQSGLPIGRRFPAQTLRAASGAEVSVPLSGNRPLLVFFVGSTCTDCKNILPFLSEVESRGLDTVTMLFADSAEQVAQFTELSPLRGEVLHITQDIGHLYDVAGVPFGYILDENGRILDKGLVRSRDRVREMALRVGFDIGPAAPEPELLSLTHKHD
jgi:methylamine dehydrogenase accessory protein MauD